MEKLKILLVEDTYLTRLGTRTLLETQADFEVVGEAVTGADALQKYQTLKPDVGVVDLRLPEMDGVHVVVAIKQHDPRARLIVLSQYDSPDDVFRALKAGALGYVTKGTEGGDLLSAIRAAARGERFLAGPVAARLADHVSDDPLTHRELQILRHMARGATNGEIATALLLADKTIAAHVSSILQKLSARSRTEAVAIAVRRRILPEDNS